MVGRRRIDLMGTVLDYLKEYGDYALAEKPFSEVDSLILSQFSYLKFDEMVSGRQTSLLPSELSVWRRDVWA